VARVVGIAGFVREPVAGFEAGGELGVPDLPAAKTQQQSGRGYGAACDPFEQVGRVAGRMAVPAAGFGIVDERQLPESLRRKAVSRSPSAWTSLVAGSRPRCSMSTFVATLSDRVSINSTSSTTVVV